MSIAVKAEDFKVIDNEMGNVRVEHRPAADRPGERAEARGRTGVTSGEINLDPILDAVGQSAYATEQTEFDGTAGPLPASARAPLSTRAFASFMPAWRTTLQVDVRLTVPNDLVVQGGD